MPFEMLLPPGYTSRESMKNVMKAKAQMFGDVTHRAGDRARPASSVGSPKTVLASLREAIGRRCASATSSVLCQFGTLPADLTRKNLELFAKDVLPALKKL